MSITYLWQRKESDNLPLVDEEEVGHSAEAHVREELCRGAPPHQAPERQPDEEGIGAVDGNERCSSEGADLTGVRDIMFEFIDVNAIQQSCT